MSAVFGLVAVGFWTLSEGRLDDAHRTAAEVLVKQPASAEGLRLLAAAL
ncbi:MAG: hypothetical protein HQL39_03035, partial [Alphaproteobacteria bacterium]|nr:hypothetical protein [Alphaproteobacteria bacterium]